MNPIIVKRKNIEKAILPIATSLLALTLIAKPLETKACFWCGGWGWGPGAFGWGHWIWWIMGLVFMVIILVFAALLIVFLFKEITKK